VTIAFPWGSLLRGVLALDDAAADGIAALLAPGSAATTLLAPAPRDQLPDLPTAAQLIDPADEAARFLCERWRCRGLTLRDLRPATHDDVDSSHSTWARRLRAGRDADRPVARFELRAGPGGGAPAGA
jgi:16S rRNA (adenine(1408)-N(1))-methyltransferase